MHVDGILFIYGGIYGRKEIEGFWNNKVPIQHKDEIKLYKLAFVHQNDEAPL